MRVSEPNTSNFPNFLLSPLGALTVPPKLFMRLCRVDAIELKASTPEGMVGAINETLSRTIITSVTTLLALLAIYFFGGEILKGFSLAMILGVVFGTYSSIYIDTAVPGCTAVHGGLIRTKFSTY